MMKLMKMNAKLISVLENVTNHAKHVCLMKLNLMRHIIIVKDARKIIILLLF